MRERNPESAAPGLESGPASPLYRRTGYMRYIRYKRCGTGVSYVFRDGLHGLQWVTRQAGRRARPTWRPCTYFM